MIAPSPPFLKAAPAAVGLGHSRSADPREAWGEVHATLGDPGAALVVFFCSGAGRIEQIAAEARRRFGATPLVGCTTAGEIGGEGYQEDGIAALSLPAEQCSIATTLLGELQRFTPAQAHAAVASVREQLEAQTGPLLPERTFALLLIDGLSVREETVIRVVQHALGKIPLIGGSAGDQLAFSDTQVFYDGRFHRDSAVLALVTTSLPFRVFNTHHFVADENLLIVTGADAARRVVTEINGVPAAEAYGAAIGCAPAQLGPTQFAIQPLVVRIDGAPYVRSIQRANADGSLTFYCAIEEGLVLRVAHGDDLAGNLRRTLARIRSELGPLQAVLACDCILRKLECERTGLRAQLNEIFHAHRVVGFSSYGEQFGGVHMNQTATGIAFGGGREHPT